MLLQMALGGRMRVRVLLVEDTRTAAAQIEQILAAVKEPSFLTERVPDLALALDRAARGGIDLVLLDLHLPDSQGIDTLTRMLAGAPGVPVVVLTGTGDDTLGIQAMRLGAQDYFPKGRLDGAWVARALTYAIERQHFVDLVLAHARKLSNLIQHAPVGMVLLDSSGSIVLVNPAAEAILDLPAAELVGHSLPFDVRVGEAEEIQGTDAAGGTLVLQVRSVPVDWDGTPHVLVTLRPD